MKRLGDRSFMLRLFSLAMSCYDSIKKDFNLQKSSLLYLSASVCPTVLTTLGDVLAF